MEPVKLSRRGYRLQFLWLPLIFSAMYLHAQTFTVLHTFTGGNDGGVPEAGLAIDRAGNLYGTASAGGVYNQGTVFRVAYRGSGWVFTPLYAFGSTRSGATPEARVTIAPDGSLYGTTFAGGNNGCGFSGQSCGTVFHLQPPATFCGSISCPWIETPIYSFGPPPDGGNPAAELVFDAAGNLYGTTEYGGDVCVTSGCGTVYKLTRSQSGWTESLIHEFQLWDGAFPVSGVAFDAAGNLYGTAAYGGSENFGTVYQLMPSGQGWLLQVLHSFQYPEEGAYPRGTPILDSAGRLYGTTGTAQFAAGTAFQLTSSNGGWIFNTIYSFTGYNQGPYGGLVMDNAGNLYGTTYQGGLYNIGSVFKLSPTDGGWTYSLLHDFTGGEDGKYPWGALVLDSNGDIYGTASMGGNPGCTGNYGCGVVWEITP